MYNSPPLGIRGFLIDSPTPGNLRGLRDGALILEDGCIAEYGGYESLRGKYSAGAVRWAHSPESVIIPGLMDLHTHLPQYPAVARGESSMQSWMDRRILPLERGFNASTARVQAPAFFEALARQGTTCAVVSASVQAESCEAAFVAAERSGLRVVMGKVMRDAGGTGPKEKDAEKSWTDSESLCRKWHGRDEGRLEYAFSPQSAVTCSREILTKTAELAQQHGAFIQSHLSENLAEGDALRGLFSQADSCAGIFEGCGILGERTLLAHCVHLSGDEIAKIGARHTAAVHCPTSNFFLTSGLMPLDRMLEAGVRVGLGSDVAGGPELNLWQVMRSAIEAQKARFFHDATVPVPSVATIFHLATHGGADVLGKSAFLGTLDVGKQADVVVLDLAHSLPYGRKTNLHADVTAEDVLEMLVYRGGAANVVETFVRGKSVYKAPAPLLL